MIVSDSNASLPESANPVDVAALIKYYLASLPEPLTTFELYNEIKDAHSSIHAMRNVLKKLPSVNYMTLEFITALFLRVSQKSLLNKVGNFSLYPFFVDWIVKAGSSHSIWGGWMVYGTYIPHQKLDI